jgi:D-glycero-D-manno-heptose 1,7-bisphosphate phosphatase
MPRRAAFLDRDGVVNREVGYLHHWEDFEFLPGVLDAMRRLHQAGYALVIVMREAMAVNGSPAAGIYHCPHHPAGTVAELSVDCDCRKPLPGMLLQAARDLDLSLLESIMVGDKLADAQAGRAAGVGHVFLVRSGHALEAGAEAQADSVFNDLAACVDALVSRG